MPVQRRRAVPGLVLASALLASSALSPAAPAVAASVATAAVNAQARAVWPHEHTDVKPDPALRYGVLPNGMRYILMRNSTPPGQIAMRLRFDVGSFMETHDEKGLAHFIEHMTFDGSTHVKPHEIIKILERHGLAFGPDTNAQTSWDQTVYQLDLPKNDADTVDTGLFLMRETAGNIDFDAKAFQNERGVVLGEERDRDSPTLRVIRQNYDFLMPGQLAPRRFPIGSTEVVKTAPRQRLIDFYHRYYRPERATLVVVGDFDPDAMAQKIRAKFSDWTGKGPAGADPSLGKVEQRGEQTRLVVEPGAASWVTLNWTNPPEVDCDSTAYRKEQFIRALGFAVLNRRLERIARENNPPFLAAAARRNTLLESADVTTVYARLDPAHYMDGVRAIETEVKQAAEYGVTQAELEQEITETRASLKAAAESEATRTSPALADDIAESVNDKQVYTSPSQDLALFEDTVKGLAPATVSTALKAEFTGSGPLVFAVSPTPVEGGEMAVAQAFDQAKLAQVGPPKAELAKAWPYTDFGQVGKVVETKEIPDLDATFVRFANGVRLTVKPTKFHKDQILVSVRAGQGRIDQPLDQPSSMWALGQGLYVEGGLKDLTAQQVDEALTGKVVGVSFGVGDDTFALSGATRPEDFASEMQLLTAYLTQPGWREEAWTRAKTVGLTWRHQLEADPTGVFQLASASLLRSGDKRWTFPTQAQMKDAKLAEIEGYVSKGLSTGPLEVVIVGDISVDEAIRQTALTFGALPPRPAAAPAPAAARQVRFPTGVKTPVRLTHKGRADQAIAFIGWPTSDYVSDPTRARQLEILDLVLQLRMTDLLRQKEGVTYSPEAIYNASWDYPGYGYVGAAMEAPPDKLDRFFRGLKQIARDLRDKPVSADELERALKPEIDRREREQASSNGYWLNALAHAQTDPRRLDAIRGYTAGLERVTPAQIQAVAREYLRDDKAYKLIVDPETKVASAAPVQPTAAR